MIKLDNPSASTVNGYVNHDTYNGFIYTNLFDQINSVGGNTTPVGTYPNGKSAYHDHQQPNDRDEHLDVVSLHSNAIQLWRRRRRPEFLVFRFIPVVDGAARRLEPPSAV